MPDEPVYILPIVAFLLWCIPVVLVYYGFRKHRSIRSDFLPSVSVIVAAHNEAEMLPRCFEHLLNQQYALGDRILIIDDRSSDATPEIIRRYRRRRPDLIASLRIEATPSGWQPKKYALYAGARLAHTEVLLFTDADCAPGPEWVARMRSSMGGDVEVAIGFAPLTASSASLSARLARVDSFATGIITAGGVGLGKPFLATGRSFAVRRERYLQPEVHSPHQGVPSGDDDLLLQQLSARNGARAAFLIEAAAQVHSPAPDSLARWLRQRARHVQASLFYPPPVQLGFVLYHLCGALLHVLPALLFGTGAAAGIALLVLMLRWAIEMKILSLFAHRASARISWVDYLLWAFFMPYFSALAHVYALRRNPDWASIRNGDNPKTAPD